MKWTPPPKRRIANLATRDGDADRRSRMPAFSDWPHCRRRRGRESHRAQAADRLPVAPGVAARDGSRSRRAASCSNRVPLPRTARSPAMTTTPMRSRVEPHSHRDPRAGSGADLRVGHARSAGRPTTGLLTAVGYVKDNRLLPRGFEKDHGGSMDRRGRRRRHRMPTFPAAGDRVRYAIDVAQAERPFQIDAELRFQVIGFRWAENLRPYTSEETSRFVALLRIDGFLVVRSAGRASHRVH